ncbi:MAG: hypothetical protein IPM39_12655 [Chloroflexi bacterium]|nr:hypothetical protein [Chloroflexota bacterium]
MTTFTSNEQIDKSKIWPTGLAAIGLSLVANLLAYFILNAVLDLPSPAEFPPLSAAAIGIMTVLFTFLAVVAFVVVVRMAKRPLRTYRIVATVVFVLSIIPNIISAVNPAAAPFPFPAASASGFLVLIIFHVIAYLIMVWLLTTKTGKT